MKKRWFSRALKQRWALVSALKLLTLKPLQVIREHNICSICENICSFVYLICPSSPLSSFLMWVYLSPPVWPPFCRGPPGEEVSLRARAPHTGFTGRPERACNKDWLQHSPWQLELRWGDPAWGCHSSQVNDNRIMCDCTDNCATYATRHHKRFNQGLTCRNTAFGSGEEWCHPGHGSLNLRLSGQRYRWHL